MTAEYSIAWRKGLIFGVSKVGRCAYNAGRSVDGSPDPQLGRTPAPTLRTCAWNTSTKVCWSRTRAKVAKLVDALVLGTSGATRESSSLSFRTIRRADGRGTQIHLQPTSDLNRTLR